MNIDNYYMAKVLGLAAITQNETFPNPRVAALIVKNQQIIGSGIHLKSGDLHAEIIALNQAGSLASGATLYVNLEPCSHYGRTPPCVDAIIKAGIKRVVIAVLDYNPVVSGAGVKKLEENGVEVRVGVLDEEAFKLNQKFFYSIINQKPWVSLKVAMSIDGKIATHTKKSQWISNLESRMDVHYYRSYANAILVGANTILEDNPSLTPYLLGHDYLTKLALKIVLDPELKTPLNAKIIKNNPELTWIFTLNQAPELTQAYLSLGVKLINLNSMELGLILNYLYQNGVYHLLVEGGGYTYTSFIEAELVNQLICYLSPQIIGGDKAISFVSGLGFSDLVSNLKFKLVTMDRFQDDVKLVYQKVANV